MVALVVRPEPVLRPRVFVKSRDVIFLPDGVVDVRPYAVLPPLPPAPGAATGGIYPPAGVCALPFPLYDGAYDDGDEL